MSCMRGHLLCLVLLSHLLRPSVGWTTKDLCEACEDIEKAFDKGMARTSRANFGGGNTAWEESRLGSFRFSETRLVSILEKICTDDDRHKHTCHHLIEEHEEKFEEWWAKKKEGSEEKLHQFLCIDRLKVCCPALRFGPNCQACPALVSLPAVDGKTEEKACRGHGSCDGAGTRSGTGKCECDLGYEGDHCSMCKDDFYNASSGNATLHCKECHSACAGGCSGPGPDNCTAGCRDGWAWRTDEGNGSACVDVDECLNTTHPVCGDGKFCNNTPGTFACQPCHVACAACRGEGEGKCTRCIDGYRFTGAENATGTCVDVDECSENSTICQNGKICTNTPGSFTCTCPTGWQENDAGVCEETKEEAKEEEEEEEPIPPISSGDGTSKDEEAKTEEASEGDETKREGAPEGDEAKREGAPKGDETKKEGAPEGDETKKEGASEGDETKKEGASEGDEAKREGAPKAAHEEL